MDIIERLITENDMFIIPYIAAAAAAERRWMHALNHLSPYSLAMRNIY